MKHTRTHATAALALAPILALAACGGAGDGGAGDPAGTAEPTAAAPGAAGADDEREEAALRCPDASGAAAAGPDIVGVRLGMTVDEALAAARCALGEDARVKTAQRWLDRLETYGVELGTQSFTLHKGDHRPCNYQREWQECDGDRKWTHVDEVLVVATPGAPGKETARAIWRTQHFREGRMPAVQAVLDALVAKYGAPQWTEESDRPWSHSAGYRELRWVRDRRGAPLADPNPLFRQCDGAIHGRDEQTSAMWRDGCGLTIRARVLLSGKNPGLALELQTAMLEQSQMYAHVEAMKSELQQLGQARRDDEVRQAGDASDVRL